MAQQQTLDAAGLAHYGEAFVREIEDRIVRLKRSRIREVNTNAARTRASSIGHPCERFLYYERTENDKRLPIDERVQEIFDLGNQMENYVLRELEDAGIRIVQRGRDFVDDRLELSGHVDARLGVPNVGEIQTEIKSMAPWIWESIETVEDLLGSRKPWLRRYPAQLQTYLYLSGEPLGLFGLINKSTGRKRWLPMALDFGYVEGLLKKAEHVRDAVRAGVAPERQGDRETCAACAFVHVCGPDLMAGPGIQIAPEEVIDLLDAREVLAPAVTEAKEIDDRLHDLFAKVGEWLAGDWVISVSASDRKAYQVKASTILRRNYKKMPPGGLK